MVRLSILCLLLGLYAVQALHCDNSYQKKCVARNFCRVGSETGTPVIQFRSLADGNKGCPAAESCCPITEISPFPIMNQGANQPFNGCGNVNPNGLTFTITSSGDTAQEGELPWMVVLLDAQLQPIGGGSLIESNVVLTSTSKIQNLTENQLIVRAGEWDLNTNTEQNKHEDVFIRKIVRHPGFNKDNGANNVALLFLARPLQLTRHINLICLPPPNRKYTWNRCIVSGWGMRNLNEISYMNLMKKIEVPLVDSLTCEQQLKGPYTSTFQLDNSLICAGGEAGKDSCEGDGGGPLACPIQGDPTRYEQVGIVNFGAGCGDPIAAAYTDVSKMRTWIDYQIQVNSDGSQGRDNRGYNPTGFPGQGTSQYDQNAYQGPDQGRGPVTIGNSGFGTNVHQGTNGNNRNPQNNFQGSGVGGYQGSVIANNGYGYGQIGYPVQGTGTVYDPSGHQGGHQGGGGGGGLAAPVPVSQVSFGTGGGRYGNPEGGSIGNNGNDLSGHQGGFQGGVGGGGSQALGQDQDALGNSRYDQNGYLGSPLGGGIGASGNNIYNPYQGPGIQGGVGGGRAPIQSGFQGPAQGQDQGIIANNEYGQSGYQGPLQGGGGIGASGNHNYQGHGNQGGIGGGGFGLGGGSGFDRDQAGFGGGGHTDEHKAKENPNGYNIIRFDITTTTTTESTPVAMEIQIV